MWDNRHSEYCDSINSYPSSQQQSCTISSSIVSESDLHAIVRELVRVGRFYNTISLYSGIRYLATYVLIGCSNNHTIFRRIVFVLILYNQPFSCKVVGFAFTAPTKLNLEPLVIRLVFNHLYKYLQKPNKRISNKVQRFFTF